MRDAGAWAAGICAPTECWRTSSPGAQLVVVVDPEPKRAGFVAEEARELFGVRPRDFRSLEEAVAAFPDLAMVDIVATAGAHHSIAQVAFEAGLEVLTEKPMAPTVSACRAMQATAQEHGRILSIVPEFALDDRTVRYFGGRRLARYQQSTWHGARESDLKLLAMEVSELLDAIEKGTPIEVGPEEGLAAVALVMAFHESSEAGRWVSYGGGCGRNAEHFPGCRQPRVGTRLTLRFLSQEYPKLLKIVATIG